MKPRFTKEEVRSFILESIADILDVEQSSIKTDIPFDNLGIDSMSVVSLIVLAEDKFSITVPDDSMPNMGMTIDTVNDLLLNLLYRVDSDEKFKPKRKDNLLINNEGDTPSFIDPSNGKIYITNQIGRNVLLLANGCNSIGEIIRILTEKYRNTCSQRVNVDIHSFIYDCEKKGLITQML